MKQSQLVKDPESYQSKLAIFERNLNHLEQHIRKTFSAIQNNIVPSVNTKVLGAHSTGSLYSVSHFKVCSQSHILILSPGKNVLCLPVIHTYVLLL